jgi:AraC family transcriptional regulator, regulatory protein of adaptative response / methylated-DNA-[protein]-cysteine methyltransferase
MDATDYGRVEAAIRYLEENFRSQPGLAEIARHAQLSEFHFQRVFTRWAGISPKRFLQVLTASFARQLLQDSRAALDAAYAAGLSGPGRLHDLIVNVYAVTPRELREEGAGITIRYGVHPSPFGECFLAVTGKGVCALSFLADGEPGAALAELNDGWRNARRIEDPGATRPVLERIFGPPARRRGPALSVVVRGTNFQVRVWEALVRIPPGFVVSYEDVAARVDAPRAVRAVGTAVGSNPVAYLIPCHRVIRKSGAFGNYGGGTARKKAMLAWEAARFGGPG